MDKECIRIESKTNIPSWHSQTYIHFGRKKNAFKISPNTTSLNFSLTDTIITNINILEIKLKHRHYITIT